MRTLLTALTVLLTSLHSLASSPYYCTYVGDDQAWYESLSWRGQANYHINPGWNQSSSISKAVTNNGDDNDEFGMCSNVTSSTPENLRLNFYWVSGEKLSSVGDSCMYQGDKLRFKTTTLPIRNSNSYIHAFNHATVKGVKLTFLNIAGIRSHDNSNLNELCKDILSHLSDLPLVNKRKEGLQLEIKKDQRNSVRIIFH